MYYGIIKDDCSFLDEKQSKMSNQSKNMNESERK